MVYSVFLSAIATALLAISCNNILEVFIIFIVILSICLIVYRLNLEKFTFKSFNKLLKKKNIDKLIIYFNFYEDYLTMEDKDATVKILYVDIDKIIETDDNFYLKCSRLNKTIIIIKKDCELELINFVKDKFDNIENRKGNKVKPIKFTHNPSFIKNGMIVLFVLTLFTIVIGSELLNIVDKLTYHPGYEVVLNNYVYWLLLPIPILSIILGFKYNYLGFKCTKNIVAGFIMSFLLFLIGATCLFYDQGREYSEIYKYNNIINLDLPNDGKMQVVDWDTYFDNDKTKYTIIDVYYQKQNTSKLENSIKNNNNLLLSKNMQSELQIILPRTLNLDDDTYLSIYNKTLDEYNKLPIKSGDYEIYVMFYDISDKKLTIHKYVINYRIKNN